MKSIGIFCGSSFGTDPQFKNTVSSLGRLLAQREISVVYGGANVGLMSVLADSVLNAGGRITGVMPRFLQKREIAHPGLSEIIFCESMHDRKKKMFELSEGFLALPGGFGTLDEIFEILSWRQLGLHDFPIAFLNIDGFFDHLKLFFDHMAQNQFLSLEGRKTALFESDINVLLDRMTTIRSKIIS